MFSCLLVDISIWAVRALCGLSVRPPHAPEKVHSRDAAGRLFVLMLSRSTAPNEHDEHVAPNLDGAMDRWG